MRQSDAKYPTSIPSSWFNWPGITTRGSSASTCLKEEGEWHALVFDVHKIANQTRNLVCLGIQREVSRVEYVDLRFRHVHAVPFRLAGIEREVVLAPDDQEPWLRLLQPCLPLRISGDVRAVVIEEIALNLRLPGAFRKAYSSVQRSGS